jgi:hypothetical protein
MLRSTLQVCALLVPAVAFAQSVEVERCDTPVYAGTLVLATGELIPPGAKSFPEANTQVIYNNTCSSGFFFGSGDTIIIDEGRVPSYTSPAPAAGVRNAYFVNGFQVAYCTREVDVSFGGPGASMNVYLWEDYDDCADSVSAGTPTASITLSGLPASDALETLSCYVVDIDLTGSGFEFCLLGDADGAFDDDATLDGFGYGLQMTNVTATGSAGPVIAGDPALCAVGDGTFYQNPGAAEATGLGNDDLFFQDPGGCFFFGGAPFAGFHFTLSADIDDCTCLVNDCNGNGVEDICDIESGTSLDANGDGIPDECQAGVGTPYCFGVGCPCGNDSPTTGCVNSSGVGALLDATGSASVSAADLGLSMTGLATNSVTLVVLSTQTADKPFKDGKLCLGGSVKRLWKHLNSGKDGTLQVPGLLNLLAIGPPFLSVQPGDAWNFQAWYRDPNASPCGNKSNLTNGYAITFVP